MEWKRLKMSEIHCNDVSEDECYGSMINIFSNHTIDERSYYTKPHHLIIEIHLNKRKNIWLLYCAGAFVLDGVQIENCNEAEAKDLAGKYICDYLDEHLETIDRFVIEIKEKCSELRK